MSVCWDCSLALHCMFAWSFILAVIYIMCYLLCCFSWPLYFYLQAFIVGLQGDSKYRCSETGYRIPFKCVEIKDSTKDAKKTKSLKGRSSLEIPDGTAESQKVSHVDGESTHSQSVRRLADDSSSSENSSQAYITYRSCITPVNEEKLSVLNFEVILSYQLTLILIFAQLPNLVDWKNDMI